MPRFRIFMVFTAGSGGFSQESLVDSKKVSRRMAAKGPAAMRPGLCSSVRNASEVGKHVRLLLELLHNFLIGIHPRGDVFHIIHQHAGASCGAGKAGGRAVNGA